MSVFKSIKYELLPMITYLLKRSLSKGVFPNITKVLPLYKKGDKNKCKNYRPISLLPQLSKILEKIIKLKLSSFIDKHKLLSKCQYGFRENMSASDALSDVVETVNSKLEKLDNCAILSIDLCKVFDKLDHGIMLNKLEMYGIRGIPLKLIKSYLTNRSQYINIDN